jgi:imidazolonepropionase-like amidohydrolase
MRIVTLAALVLASLQSAPDEIIAIRGAKVVVAPGREIASATVVVRRGLIERVGGDEAAPAGARVIEAAGMVVYAGFIDSHCKTGLPDTALPAEQVRLAEGHVPDYTKEALPRMEEANRKGIRPQLQAADLVNVTEASAKDWIGSGFAAANVAVGGEYFSGRGVLLSLSGAPRRSAIIPAAALLHAGFRNSGENYPRTVMGVLAHMRQALLDARRHRELHEHYLRNPVGTPRPPSDPALDALLEALDGKVRVAFEADSDTEIRRALGLAEEFGLKVVIAGGAEAHKAVDELKRAGAPVLLSLKWPKEPKELKKDDLDKFVPRPKKLLDEEKRLYEERVSCAIALRKGGIPFAFSTWETKPSEALKNLEKLLKKGLPVDAALAALTTVPAELFGVADRLGTIERGKIANLSIFTKPIGEKGSKARYMIVDGKFFDLEEQKKPVGDPKVDLTGRWNAVASTPQGEIRFTLELEQKGSEVTGSITSMFGEAKISSGTVGGESFEISAGLGERGEIAIRGELKEGKMEGSLSGPGGIQFDWSATKEPKKEADRCEDSGCCSPR